MTGVTEVQTQPVAVRKKRDFHYHIETRNMSFLQTAKDLKLLGIKNNMFFLKLFNPSLRHVDPFNPNLPQEVIVQIINECIVNPYYFLRECVRIPDQGGNGIPYQLHRGNLSSTHCFLNGLDHYLVLPRQKGKTMSTLAVLNWAFLFGTTNSEFMFINKRQKDANNNLSRLKDLRDLLPKYLQFKVSFSEEGKALKGQDNVQTITNPTTNNKIETKPSARSVEAAEGIGRGCTQPVQYYDEVEFTPFIKTIIEAAGPAYNTASGNAKRNNAAYCRIFTSTPGDLDTQPGQDALQIIEKTCKWTEKFYDWTVDEVEDYISTNSGNGIIYIEYQYTQLGDDEEWFKKTCRTLLNNPVKIKREIFLQRMRGSSESPFDMEELEVLQEHKGTILEEIFINKFFKLDIYEPLSRELTYLVGVDASHGLGKDNSAVTIIHPRTLKTVAEFKSPYIGVTDYTKFLQVLIRRHIPNAILCIERNNVGEAIIDALRQTDVRNRIYFDDSKDLVGIDDKLDSQGFLQRESAKRKMFGVYTQTKSREIMMTLLDTHMQEHKEKFVGLNVINDILSLVRNKRGKVEAAAGFHDDSVMSYLIALYVWYYGKNLSRFGFSKAQEVPEDERNNGLTYEDLVQELPSDVQQSFTNAGSLTQDDYSLKMRMEIEKARREMDYVDTLLNPVNQAENFDKFDGGNSSFPLDLFDELND